jgi:NTE family protein
MKALVLSGGGAFGAYQAGAWRALCEAGWRPDIVLGTSIGAVNGYLISRSASPDDMRAAWLDLPPRVTPLPGARWPLPYSRAVPRFRGWVAEIGRSFSARPAAARLQVCLADLLTGAMRVIEDGAVTPHHLLAACALPSIVPPVRLDGRFYLDGGVFYPLPLKEAIAVGADEIVAVDLLRVTPCQATRRLRLALLSVRNFLRRETSEPTPEQLAGVRLCPIGHSHALGSTRQCFEWSEGRAKGLIETGYQDAAAALRSF